MKVLGSMPRVLHEREISTAGCSPRVSAMAGWASAATTRVAANEGRALMFIAGSLKDSSVGLQYHWTSGRDKPPESGITVRENGQWIDYWPYRRLPGWWS